MSIDLNDKNPIFFIPISDKYLVYLPLKPMAFIANKSMVDYIKTLSLGDLIPDIDNDINKLLFKIGFFLPPNLNLDLKERSDNFKPTVCVLLLTTACNLSCVYCYASSGLGVGKKISSEIGKKAIDIVCQNSIDMNLDSFTLSLHGGGEPTVAKKELFELIDYAKKKELKSKISLTTNGYLNGQYTDELLKHGVDEISLSFDGLPMVQNKQRPTKNKSDSADTILKFINKIEKKGIPYGMRLSVMDNSLNQLATGIEFLCRETSCSIFQVEPVFAHGRAEKKDNFLRKNHEFICAFINAQENTYKYNRHMYYSGVRPWLATDSFCLAPETAFIVNHDGELTLCYEVYDRAHKLNNDFFYGAMSKKGIPIIDLEKRNNLFKKIEKRKAGCRKKNCFCYYFCAGDCPPKAFHSEKIEKKGFSSRCELNRELTVETLLFYIDKLNGVWHGEKIG